MNPTSPKVFPVVSLGKFTLLFCATVGLYHVYWLYRNWMSFEQSTGRKVFRLGRTLFAVFFVHELFAEIARQNQLSPRPLEWKSAQKAWVFIGADILALFLFIIGEQFQLRGPTYGFFSIVIARLIYFYALYSAQLVINRSADDPFGKSNQKITMGNQIAIICGLYLWINSFYVVYLDVTGQLPEPEIEQPSVPMTERAATTSSSM